MAPACGGERGDQLGAEPRHRGETRQDERASARDETDETVEVLRGVWTASGQDGDELAELFGPAKSCKNMQNVGFDDFAGSEGDIREAWRATLRAGRQAQRASGQRQGPGARPRADHADR